MENQNETWAVVELMGHDVTAGIIKPSELGGSLIRIDVPDDGDFRTEYIGDGAVFRIRIVSEEIARIYAAPERGVIAYDEPIVPRAQFDEALRKARTENENLRNHIHTLNQRLTAIEPGEKKLLPDTEQGEDWVKYEY